MTICMTMAGDINTPTTEHKQRKKTNIRYRISIVCAKSVSFGYEGKSYRSENFITFVEKNALNLYHLYNNH